jgi:ribosomal protein S27AE
MGTDRFVTIDRFFDPIEARIVAGRLEASGIPVHLLGIHHASANWLITVALGGVQLQVPLARVEEAKQLLSEDVALDSEEEVCPQCGGADLALHQSASWKASLLVTHLFQVPLPWKRKRRRCGTCGHVWSDDA